MSLTITKDGMKGLFVIKAEDQDDPITTPDFLDIAPVIAHYFHTKEHEIYKKHGVCLLCDAVEAALINDPLGRELIKRAVEEPDEDA